MTLFGFASGGSSVHYHMLSEKSKGLFHKAISMGGSALVNTAYTVPRLQWAEKLASALGFNSTDETELLSFLETAAPEDIVREQNQLIPLAEGITSGSLHAFGPTVEPYATAGIFMSDEPSKLLPNAWGNDIPFIIGAGSMEYLFLVPMLRSMDDLFKSFTDFEMYIPREHGLARNTEKTKIYAEMLKNVYYPVFPPTKTNIDGLIYVSFVICRVLSRD